MPTYARKASPMTLPAPEPRSEIFSVPQPTGGYVYYQGPPGSKLGWNDNLFGPTIAHPNPIGIASTTVGVPLPAGSVRIGEGTVARGRITPMVGQGGSLPTVGGGTRGGDGIQGLGAVTIEESSSWTRLGLAAAAVAAGVLLVRSTMTPNRWEHHPRSRAQQKALNRALKAGGYVDF